VKIMGHEVLRTSQRANWMCRNESESFHRKILHTVEFILICLHTFLKQRAIVTSDDF